MKSKEFNKSSSTELSKKETLSETPKTQNKTSSSASQSEKTGMTSSMAPKVYSKTHTGKVRQNNQDSLLVNKDCSLFAVADGMGGHTGGEVASSTAIKALDNFISIAMKNGNFTPTVHLVEGFHEANAQVFQKSRENNGKLMGMGTTLVACFLWKNKAFFANVGDSRAYLFRYPHLWRITEDHSILNMQMKKGLIKEEKAALFSESNVITRSIGFISEVEVDLFQKDLVPDDLFLLCSDGLNEIPDQELCNIFKKYSHDMLVEKVVQTALDAGGNDNISAIIISP